jgi:hypothetical protein
MGFKVSDAKPPTSITLDGTDAPGNWLTSYFNLNNDGCLGPGSKDNACAYAQGSNTGGGGKDAPTSGIYYWDFTITFEQTVPVSAFGNTSNPIRAWFVGLNGAECVGPSSRNKSTPKNTFEAPGELHCLGPVNTHCRALFGDDDPDRLTTTILAG